VAQIVFARAATVAWDEVPGLSGTERGAGGFGSTGSD
jgi:dUTP pyrophosphatase